VACWCGNSFFCVLAFVRGVRLVFGRPEGFVALRARFGAFLAFRGFGSFSPLRLRVLSVSQPSFALPLPFLCFLAFFCFRVLAFFCSVSPGSPSLCSARGGRGALRGLRASVPSLSSLSGVPCGALLSLVLSVLSCGFGLSPAGRSVLPCGSWRSAARGRPRRSWSVGFRALRVSRAFSRPYARLGSFGRLGSSSLLRPRGGAFPAVGRRSFSGSRAQTRSGPGVPFGSSGPVRSGLHHRALGASRLPWSVVSVLSSVSRSLSCLPALVVSERGRGRGRYRGREEDGRHRGRWLVRSPVLRVVSVAG